MRFTKIVLENMFAYEGRVEFDLTATTPERNIVLIWGRNGMGKTSFLRALKILFMGTEPQEIRSVGFPRQTLGVRQFVVGDGQRWTGLVNKRSRLPHRDATASVSVDWVTKEGQKVHASRHWTVSDKGFEETVIFDDGERLTKEAARNRLWEIVPPEFVGFFFFDGEEVKSLAEDSGPRRDEIDRVLRLTYLDRVSDQLREIAKERRRLAMDRGGREALDRLEQELDRAVLEQRTATQKVEELDAAIDLRSRELARLQRRRENLSGGSSDVERAALERRRDEARSELATAQGEFARLAVATAPLATNPTLVARTVNDLREHRRSQSSIERNLLDGFAPLLPDWLADEPAALAPLHAAEVAADLVRRMMRRIPEAGEAARFSKLGAAHTEDVLDQLAVFSGRGGDGLRLQIAALDGARRAERRVKEIEEELIQLEVGTTASVAEYRLVREQITRLDSDVQSMNQERGRLAERVEQARLSQQSAKAEIARRLKDVETAEEGEESARQVDRLASAVNELQDRMRQRSREEIEARLNDRFRTLVQHHDLVHRVSVSETYALNFYDEMGNPIGRASLSSGLMQLAATALLWALKDVSAVDMPVVIDTPLARIDRENQKVMLEDYYPNVGQQVIILPTNSEMDQAKFDMIRDHVAKQYLIVNQTGEAAAALPDRSLLEVSP